MYKKFLATAAPTHPDIETLYSFFTDRREQILDVVHEQFGVRDLAAPVCVPASRSLHRELLSADLSAQMVHLYMPMHHCFNYVTLNDTSYIMGLTYRQFTGRKKKLPEIALFAVQDMKEYQEYFMQQRIPFTIFGLWRQGLAEYRLS